MDGTARLLGDIVLIMKKRLVLLAVVSVGARMFADSPITSTDFYRAYLDLPIVIKAESHGVIDLEIADYLHSASIPLDLKAAVVNALSWGPEEKRNAEFFSYYLALEYGVPLDRLYPERISPTDLFCLGYLTILDDYFEPSYGLLLMDLALEHFEDSMVASIVTALARAQDLVMGEDSYDLWPVIEEVITNQSLRRDFRPLAMEIIVDYMSLYR